ncbi:MAG: hypothetical protein V1748_11675 [Actinomycetota bacterium]
MASNRREEQLDRLSPGMPGNRPISPGRLKSWWRGVTLSGKLGAVAAACLVCLLMAATAVAAGARASGPQPQKGQALLQHPGSSRGSLTPVQDDLSGIFTRSSATRERMLGDLDGIEALAVSKSGGGNSSSVEVKVLVMDGTDIPAPAGDPAQLELANSIADEYAGLFLAYYAEVGQVRRRCVEGDGDERAGECRRLQRRACDYLSRAMLEYGRAVDMLRGGTQQGLQGAAHVIEIAEELRVKGRKYIESARRALASL